MEKRIVLALMLIFSVGCASTPNSETNGTQAASPLTPGTAERVFDSIKHDPVALRTFLTPFPKGADLHSHLSGAVYAESYIRWAVEADLCIYVEIHQLNDCPAPVPETFRGYTQVRLEDQLVSDPDYRYRLIDAFSVRNYVQSHGGPSGADQFFLTFNKFDAATNGRNPHMLAEVLNRAGAQRIAYLELMMTPTAGVFLGMGAALDWSGDLPAMEAALLARDFRQRVAFASEVYNRDLARARDLMACGTAQAQPGCDVEVRILAQALRDFDDIGSVFALIMASFYVAAENDNVVGVNFVMREDGRYALRDYAEHMRIMKYFTGRFPRVSLSLHAGELTLGLVPPEDLKNHIALAVASGAKRIGHGIDIAFEDNAADTLGTMAAEGIMVEINLTSNRSILGVYGDRHPFMTYRRAGVPTALSTDDEGVLRSDLTHEYVTAVLEYGLSYQELKELSRNGIRYAFLAENQKAQLIAALEQAFADFEAEPPRVSDSR